MPQLLGEHLAEDRAVPLSRGLHAEPHDQLVAGEKQLGAFRRAAAGMFEKAGNADAAQPAASLRFGAALRKAVEPGERHGGVHHAGEVAAVIGRAAGGAVGHR